MPSLSVEVIEKFCRLCESAYKVWLMHRTLFDDNPNPEALGSRNHQEFFHLLNEVTRRSVLHQIVKLHDPAIMNGSINLTVEYVVAFGGWDQETELILKKLHKEMKIFSHALKPARNKILSHNDLQALISNKPLGGFEKGEDFSYFEKLQDFANLIHDKTKGGPYPFDDLVKNDVLEFLSALK